MFKIAPLAWMLAQTTSSKALLGSRTSGAGPALARRQRPELTNRLKVEDLEMDPLARTVIHLERLKI